MRKHGRHSKGLCSYSNLYSIIFNRNRNSLVSVTEIGDYNHLMHSLPVWSAYFSVAKIFGININDSSNGTS